MICPGCGSEYRSGYSRCRACDLSLVESVPQEVDAPLAKAYETRNAAIIPLYESLLDAAGIDYVTKHEGIQEFIGGGRAGTNLNCVVGPVEFWVRADAASEAQALASSLAVPVGCDELVAIDEESAVKDDGLRNFRDACFFVVGSILGPLALWLLYASWTFAWLGFLFLCWSFSLISKSADDRAVAPINDSDRDARSWRRVLRSSFKENVYGVVGALTAITIFSWHEDLVRSLLRSLLPTIPRGDEYRVLVISAGTILWVWFYARMIVKLNRPNRRTAA